MSKIHKNDEIIVIAGKYKGKVAKVLKILVKSKKVLIDGVNVVKKHIKPNPSKNITGGVIEINLPIDISNVAIYNQVTQKSDRVKYTTNNKKKQRIFSSDNKLINEMVN